MARAELKNVSSGTFEPFIPYGRQWIDDEDIKAVTEVLRSDRLTQGAKVEEFERAFAEYVGSVYAVAVSNGTAALHLACMAAGLGPGDQVVTSPISFVASANCALYVGASPGFADIDPETLNLDPKKLEALLESKGAGPETDAGVSACRSRAVIPVHFSGLPCNMGEISRVAGKHGLIVIEDACHALGARYRAEMPDAGQRAHTERWLRVGSCAHSSMTVFSFHPVKHITTGEGGMVTTNDKALYERLLLLRSHGITRDPDRFVNLDKNSNTSPGVPPWYYEMEDLGLNFRITDIQCALGISQLKKADWFVERRRRIAARYREGFRNFSRIRLPLEPQGMRSSFHLFTVKIDFRRLGKNRHAIMRSLSDVGIGTQVHYIPIVRQPYYQRMGFRKEDYPEAEEYYRQCLSLPIFPGMDLDDADRVIRAVKAVL